MTTARIEFLKLGVGALYDGTPENCIAGVHAVAEIEATATATAGNARPAAPVKGMARVIALGGPIIVAFGYDPTAARLTPGVYVTDGSDVVVPVNAGDFISVLAA